MQKKFVVRIFKATQVETLENMANTFVGEKSWASTPKISPITSWENKVVIHVSGYIYVD